MREREGGVVLVAPNEEEGRTPLSMRERQVEEDEEQEGKTRGRVNE